MLSKLTLLWKVMMKYCQQAAYKAPEDIVDIAVNRTGVKYIVDIAQVPS